MSDEENLSLVCQNSAVSTGSLESFASDDDARIEETIYPEAPWDIYGESEFVGKVKVAQTGDKLPLETKYVAKKGGSIGVKFSVSENLEVKVIATSAKPNRRQPIGDIYLPSSTVMSPPQACSSPRSSSRFRGSIIVNDAILDVTPPTVASGARASSASVASASSASVASASSASEASASSPQANKMAQSQFLSIFDKEFNKIVIGGLEASLRDRVAENVKNHVRLPFKQNMALIHSVNFHIFGYIGCQRPDPGLCRDIAEIIKRHIPETFCYEEKVVTEFGVLPQKKSKGEGGRSTLAQRISETFYNTHIRVGIKRLEVIDDTETLTFSKKKTRKFYGIVPEKWCLATKISKDAFEKSENNFNKLKDALDDPLEVAKIMNESREYLQVTFRTEDPSAHVQKRKKTFWKMPWGLKLLSNQFEWVVDGSKDGDLKASIEDHMNAVMKMVEKYLMDKGGEVWAKKYEEVSENSQLKNGNTVMVHVFLMRELGRIWSNKGEKLLFIEAEDNLQNVSSQPFLHINRIDQTGEADYEECIIISVRVGSTVVFEDVSLSEGLAAVIQLCFTFHLLFPVDCDDLFNFLQRILANFGPAEGAMNRQGHLKRKFVDFQCAVAAFMLQEKKGVVQKLFI